MKKLILAALMLAALPASAVTFCPGTVSTADREFGVQVTTGTGTATCLAFGPGNIIGDDNDLAGWTFIEKDGTNNNTGALTITGISSVGGTAGIDLAQWSLFDELAIAFKSGEGQLDPDWAVFRLSPVVTSLAWLIQGRQSLSHVNLYGRVGEVNPNCTDGTCPVPEPGSLALMGFGLLGIGFVARRRRV